MRRCKLCGKYIGYHTEVTDCRRCVTLYHVSCLDKYNDECPFCDGEAGGYAEMNVIAPLIKKTKPKSKVYGKENYFIVSTALGLFMTGIFAQSFVPVMLGGVILLGGGIFHYMNRV